MMEKTRENKVIVLEGGTIFRVLFSIILLGLITGMVLRVFIEKLPYVDDRKAQERAEGVLLQAAKWYMINNGPPDHTLYTEESKQVLIPDYLNKWPGKEPIECIIQPDGTITVYTRKDGY